MVKRALLVGITYARNPTWRLHGCGNDVRAMHKF